MNDLEKVKERITCIQNTVILGASSGISDSELAHLRILVRLVVEFNDYYEGLSESEIEVLGRGLDYMSSPSAQAVHQLESIQGGSEFYMRLSSCYTLLAGKIRPMSPIPDLSLAAVLNNHRSIFHRLLKEKDFIVAYCLILNLFRLQIIWFGLIA